MKKNPVTVPKMDTVNLSSSLHQQDLQPLPHYSVTTLEKGK